MQSLDPGHFRCSLATLQRVWAAALFVLLLLSWRLWIPELISPAAVEFPRVPLTAIAGPLVAAIDLVGVAGVLVGLLMIVSRRQVSWLPFALLWVCLSALFLTNQHRLQPWAYQGWMYALIFATMAPATARRFVMALTISIYAYSSLGKFDQQFLRTVGPDFIATLLPWVDRSSEVAAGLFTAAAIALPTVELGLAILLAIPQTRRAGGYGAVAMHVMLVLILGPLGLRHSLAVIAWNGFLAVQAWLLFIRPAGDDATSVAHSTSGRPAALAAGLIVLAGLGLPLLERRGYWDHWLSWSLYSPHTSRVDIQLHRSATDALPRSTAEFLRPSDERDGWYHLAIDRWSLAELAVPVYPQARFQLGVAQVLAHQLDSPRAIRIKIRGVADRRTGQRTQLWLIGREQIEKEAKRYWLLPQH